MSVKYRVAMVDTVNGESFTFACTYTALNRNAAGKHAMKEWDRPIKEIRQVEKQSMESLSHVEKLELGVI